MCTAHPYYEGTFKPDGGCAQCLARWVARPAERYTRAEFALMDAAAAVAVVVAETPIATDSAL